MLIASITLVMGDKTRQFSRVLEKAQETLQNTFGMELAELMSRAEREQQQNGTEDGQEENNSTGLKKKGRPSFSVSLICY